MGKLTLTKNCPNAKPRRCAPKLMQYSARKILTKIMLEIYLLEIRYYIYSLGVFLFSTAAIDVSCYLKLSTHAHTHTRSLTDPT